MATKKVNNQLDIQITSTLLNSGAGYIGLGAKSDGLYQKNNTGSDLKLATTTDLSGYLPLTGGTISGNTTDLLTISAGASVSHALIVKNVSGTEIASILGNGNIVSTAGNFIGNGFLDPNTNKQGITVDSTNLYFKTNGATRGVITNSGNFLIGTTTDDGINKLQVNGTVKLAINKYINFVQDDEQPILQTSRSDGTYINYLYASGAGDFRFSKNLTVTGNITVGVSTGTQVSLLSGGYITVNSPSTSDNLVIRGKNAGGIYMNYGSGNSGSTSFWNGTTQTASISATGNATFNSIAVTSATMVTNLNSNYLKGYAVGDNASGNNGTVGFIPRVASDGVMEVGKYIDFHDANNNNVDYNTRLMSNAGALLINGNSIITSAGGTVNGNFSINKQTPALNIFGGTDDQTIINFWDDGSIISSIINDNSLGAFIFKSNNDFLFNDGLNVNQMTINSSGVDINKMSIHSTAKVVNLQADSVDGFHFWKGSLTAYNAITTKDANTMYIII